LPTVPSFNPCIIASFTAGTAACGIMTTYTKRPVSGREVAMGAIVRDIGLGDVDRLAREDDLLRIEASLAR
jgi:hypothetical protein